MQKHGSTRIFNSRRKNRANIRFFTHFPRAVRHPTPARRLSPVPPSLCTSVRRAISAKRLAQIILARLILLSKYYQKEAFLCFKLYSERGFITSRQSRSPLSRAMISTSAVAIVVATGILYNIFWHLPSRQINKIKKSFEKILYISLTKTGFCDIICRDLRKAEWMK